MTIDERVSAVESLGFTNRQARFLVTVALHGGYCMRRQYAQFSGLHYGKNVRDFLDSLIECRLAHRRLFLPNRGYVYHLHAKSLYRLLEQAENRNRRVASAALIARKLMMLDHVLTEPAGDWYATEQDKVELFEKRFRVPLMDMPQQRFRTEDSNKVTTRYFMHKLPVHVPVGSSEVRFAYLGIDNSAQALETFLDDHRRLLAHVPRWAIVALRLSNVYGSSPNHGAAFDRFVKKWHRLSRADIEDLRWFFPRVDLVVRKEMRTFSIADLDRFRDLRQRLMGADLSQLYRRWLADGDRVLDAMEENVASDQPSGGRLVIKVLPRMYTQFGSFPGVA